MLSLARIALLTGGVLLGLVAYRVQVEELPIPGEPGRALAQVAVGWAFLLAGVVGWWKRPANPLGVLMVVTAFALLFRQLRYSSDPALFTAFFALGDVGYAMVGHAILAYPSGRVSDTLERGLVRAAYAVALVFPVAALLVYDGSRPLLQFVKPAPESLLLVAGSGGTAELIQKTQIVLFFGVLASLLIALILRRLVRAGPRGRRVLAPLLLAGAAVALRAVWESIFTFVDTGVVSGSLFWWQISAVIALPLALLAGLLRARLAQASVGSLVLELEGARPDGLRDALARALGDPTLEVAFWLPEPGYFVDAEGLPVELPRGDGRRAVTRLEQDGEPVAALVHDPSLLEEPELVEAAGAAARLALENARLQVDLQAQLVAVRESRARIVAATDAERRRIERDLHDGAQQRLLALALGLRSAARRRDSLDPEVERLLDGAVGEIQGAVQELRELAHGVHPTILAEQGLAAALGSLGDRMPLPVALEVSVPERPDPAVEAAAYFVACEALANVVKHSGAGRASVVVNADGERLLVEVVDDGVGGADPVGAGLRGLNDRVEALGGRLRVDAHPEGGTRVAAELPLTSPVA